MEPEEVGAMAMLSGSSSYGDAVSGRGQDNLPDEDDELYYIPERRSPLDLGPGPMDTSHWLDVDRGLSPALSYISQSSEDNSAESDDEDGSSTRLQLDSKDSYSSCYSLDSDDVEKIIPKVRSEDDTASEPSDTPELIRAPSEIRHPSVTVAFTFKAICSTLGKLRVGDVKRFKTMLWKHYMQSFNIPLQDMDMVDLVDRLLEGNGLEASLQITKILLEEIGQKKLADYLQTLCIRNEVRHDLSETLKRTYGEVFEDLAMQEEKRPLDDVFTDLYITSTCNNGPNIEHEVMTINKLDSNREAGKLLSTKDIFSAENLEDSNIKLILLTGVAGSGKSMAVRRLILDWIEERSHQHVSFLFPLPFRELKQFEGSDVSLLEIIQTLYPETKKLRDEDYRCEDCKIMFVFDGLDEYNGKLDFENTKVHSDYRDPTTLNVIVVNLLRGRLLYWSPLLVTSRPQVKCCIPWGTFYDEIEVRGFCDHARDEYFKKRFKDPDQAARVITYVKSFKTLHIMCHLPLFCSLVADECHRIFREQGTQAELPRSTTYMYTQLVLALARQRRTFRAPDRSPEEERDFLVKLGKLAYDMLENNQFKITKSDWKNTGIENEEAVTNSGLCTQYVTKPYVLIQEKVLSFIHPTVQEYLAALYVFLSSADHEKNTSRHSKHFKGKFYEIVWGPKATELYKSAMDRSLQHEDGKLDIFLRFLFGMTLTTNLKLLEPFCASHAKWPAVTKDAAGLIRKRIRENLHPGREYNLQRCLEELGVAEAAST